jgi:hypothetical protein
MLKNRFASGSGSAAGSIRSAVATEPFPVRSVSGAAPLVNVSSVTDSKRLR